MRVLELNCVGKTTDPNRNEDAIVVTDHHVFVFDGMTDFSSSRYGGISGGRFATLAAAAAVGTLNMHATIADAVAALTDAVGTALDQAMVDGSVEIQPGGYGRPCTTFTAYSAARRQLWRVGDGHLAAGSLRELGSKAVDDAAYAFRSAVTHAHLAAGATVEQLMDNDPGTVATTVLYGLQSRFANRSGPFGYGVVDGTPVPADYCEAWPVPDDATNVVLCSDGYLSPAKTLAFAEAELAEAMVADPLGVDTLRRMGKGVKPGNVAPDDRSYIRLSI